MKHLNLPTVSMEAIQYQGRSLLLFDIVSAIEALRVYPAIDQPALDQSKLGDIVFKRTGMKVAFVMNDDHTDHSLYAEPPLLNATNPYFRLLQNDGLYDVKREVLERHHRAVRLAKDSLASIDLKTSRVGGVFSQMQNRVFMSRALLEDRSFSSEEVAAIVIHELGHLYSYFETLAYTTSSNAVINTAVEALRSTDNPTEKMRLVTSSLSVFSSFNREAVDAIANESNSDAVRTMLLKTMEEAEQDRVNTLLGNHSNAYNTRSIEFMADQFAVRHGAALALASAQHKMAKLVTPDYGRSKLSFYAVQAARISLLAATWAVTAVGVSTGAGGAAVFLFGPVMTAIVGMMAGASAVEDDHNSDPSERIAQIKQDLVQLLKNNKLDASLRKQILHDVDAIDALRAEIKEHQGIFRFVWRNVAPTGRRQSKIREFQKGLEELINNDLFLYANRLRGR